MLPILVVAFNIVLFLVSDLFCYRQLIIIILEVTGNGWILVTTVCIKLSMKEFASEILELEMLSILHDLRKKWLMIIVMSLNVAIEKIMDNEKCLCNKARLARTAMAKFLLVVMNWCLIGLWDVGNFRISTLN